MNRQAEAAGKFVASLIQDAQRQERRRAAEMVRFYAGGQPAGEAYQLEKLAKEIERDN